MYSTLVTSLLASLAPLAIPASVHETCFGADVRFGEAASVEIVDDRNGTTRCVEYAVVVDGCEVCFTTHEDVAAHVVRMAIESAV